MLCDHVRVTPCKPLAYFPLDILTDYLVKQSLNNRTCLDRFIKVRWCTHYVPVPSLPPLATSASSMPVGILAGLPSPDCSPPPWS